MHQINIGEAFADARDKLVADADGGDQLPEFGLVPALFAAQIKARAQVGGMGAHSECVGRTVVFDFAGGIDAFVDERAVFVAQPQLQERAARRDLDREFVVVVFFLVFVNKFFIVNR